MQKMPFFLKRSVLSFTWTTRLICLWELAISLVSFCSTEKPICAIWHLKACAFWRHPNSHMMLWKSIKIRWLTLSRRNEMLVWDKGLSICFMQCVTRPIQKKLSQKCCRTSRLPTILSEKKWFVIYHAIGTSNTFLRSWKWLFLLKSMHQITLGM